MVDDFRVSGGAKMAEPFDMEQVPVPQSRSPSLISLVAMGLAALVIVAVASAVGHLVAKEISFLVQGLSDDASPGPGNDRTE